MTVKTTRIKSTQAPRVETLDLSNQLNGSRQTFSLPRDIHRYDRHYLVWNSTVYRNDANHRFYTISGDGKSLTTYFNEAPKGGQGHHLQLAVDMSGDGDDGTLSQIDLDLATEELNKRIDNEVEKLQEADSAIEDKIAAETERATTAEGFLQQNINAEVEARSQDRDMLQQNINEEVEVRTKADEALSVGLNDENKRAYEAEQALQQRIENVDDQLASLNQTIAALTARVEELENKETTEGE